MARRISITLLVVLSLHFVPRVGGGVTRRSNVVPFTSGRRIDSYGRLSFKHEKRRLNNLAAVLRSETKSKGYIVVYAGQPSRMGTARVRARRALNYLVNQYGSDPKRIIAAALDSSAFDELTIELWVWPLEAPDDLPKFQPDVEAEGVFLIKGTQISKRKKST